MSLIARPLELLKSAAMGIGATTVRKDGKTWKKISATKWVMQAEGKRPSGPQRIHDKAQTHFDYAMASPLGNIFEAAMKKHRVKDMDSLITRIKGGHRELASEMYRETIDSLRTVKSPIGAKHDLADNVGKLLLLIRDQHVTAQKTKITVKKKTKSGKGAYYIKPDVSGRAKLTLELPSLKPSAISTARKKVGGWSITGPLESKHVRAMIKTKSAKLTYGKIASGKKWVLPSKAEDMNIKYKGKELTISVKQVVKKDKRTSAVAKAEIKIPYAYAKAFLISQVKSARTRNNLIFRMEHSHGYKAFLERTTK